uniref:Uncharacterized protein n=1 Tax=Podoviridae sp. ctOAf25 TaxID=2825245 RepID=A0A8S5PMI6_9CAUD|nr:MAG TPA: hypothetical protein [Podoviridae sp. ctOAf25]
MFMQEMEYIAVDIPHFMIILFYFSVLITQNQSCTATLLLA